MNELERLNNWYVSRCNGEWESDQGITLESCDNPGWWLKISLKGTGLETKKFSEVSENIGKDGHPTAESWLHCYIEDGKFNGSGDPGRLPQIISAFLDWAGV
jgi:hypothetical protein